MIKLFIPQNLSYRFLVLLFAAAFCLTSCKRKYHSDIAKILYKETGNKIFKKLENNVFLEVFRKTLANKKSSLDNPKLISTFYENNDYEPVLVLKYLPKDGLKTMLSYFNNAGQHGLDPKIFNAKKLTELINKFYDKKVIKTIEEAYQDLADLELLTANSLINYSNALQFGIINPKRIYANYYIDTKRPDSTDMIKIFAVNNLKNYMDSIQPKNKQYLALQNALKHGAQAPGMTKEESKRILEVNLERLRWKNKPLQEKYVLVNIADFRLDVIDHGRSVLNMKVCVGEGRNKKYTDKLQEYDENDLKKDRPFSRETPQLNSMIYSVQVNPIWNIPESIATNEITKEAAKDRYYLSNNNINVYKDGELIEDPETIDWSEPGAGKTYKFKQQPGIDNSLGRIKFLFKNASAVYLHDTPAKAAFNQSMRAISHGCVRLEKPLELAHILFGEGKKYELIKKQMQVENPEARDITLPKKVPVYLTYFTAWIDEEGTTQFRKDIYGLDIVLYTFMQRIMAG